MATAVAAHDSSAAAEAAAAPKLFPYIWRHSRREQLGILLIVLVSMPFYFASLDLPKSIVNDAIQGRAFAGGRDTALLFHLKFALPGFLGGATLLELPGVALARLPYLAALSFLFLALVLVNGGFKFFINMRKGKLGERLLRKLRLDLFGQILALTPEAARGLKPSEAATIIKDEVEPIGGFVGDAFIQPIFLSGQALTALLFILLQSPSLGLLTVFMVAIQGLVVPQLRREQLRLGRARQLQSRALAGRIGEIVEGLAEVGNHGAADYERARIAGQLDLLFWIRYRLFGRKFMAKFINNLLAQITPFLFYLLGGYYALAGTLDIGQLVAVIAAYRELPPPVKELIDWDQQRQDVEVKYDQVMEQFSHAAARRALPEGDMPDLAAGLIEAQALAVAGSSGESLLERASFALPLGGAIAVLDRGGPGAGVLAQLLGRRIAAYGGILRLNGQDLALLPARAAGRQLAYAGPEVTIFQGSIRDNVVYGLRIPQDGESGSLEEIGPERPAPAAADPALAALEIEARIASALRAVGMDEAVRRFGLGFTIDPRRHPDLAGRIVAARRAVKDLLLAEGAGDLIEPFDPARFNRNATLGENLLFGVARDKGFADETLADHPTMRPILEAAGLLPPLHAMGLAIARTMVEIFEGLPPDHPLFEQFSFIHPEELPGTREALARAGAGALVAEDRTRLIGLSLRYVEPRHRLGLVTAKLADRVVEARGSFMQAKAAGVESYDPGRFCAAAPLRDNLLFGRIAHGSAHAQPRVYEAMRRVLHELDLDREVFSLGLEHQTGPAGRLLQPPERAAIALARCLAKQPDVLVLNQPFAAFGAAEAQAMLGRIRAFMEGRTLIAVTRDAEVAAGFASIVEVEGARVKWAGPAAQLGSAAPAPHEPAAERSDDYGELAALRAVPLFANIDSARLRLIAFTSERLRFAPGETMFRQGDQSDSAFVLLAGAAEVRLETAAGPIHLAHIGKHTITGEMGVITGSPRSATVLATSEVAALRLSKDVLLALFAEFPDISLGVMRELIERLLKAQARLAAGGR